MSNEQAPRHTKLTISQKLKALALKYYDDLQWNPKKGDYYTSTRNDLELYQIVDEGEQFFYTKYCDPAKGNTISEWPKSTFLKEFGIRRVFVPDYLLNENNQVEPSEPTPAMLKFKFDPKVDE